MTTQQKEEILTEDLAMRLAGDLLFDVLLRQAAPMKVSHVARQVNLPGFDLRLSRVVLALSRDRFTTQDRGWVLGTREIDPRRPVERTCEEILEAGGRPQPAEVLAKEVAATYGKPIESFIEAVQRLVCNSDRFVRIGTHGYGRRCWLLDVPGREIGAVPDRHDVLFYNFLEKPDVVPYEAHVSVLQPGDMPSVLRFLDEVGAPVPSRVLQFLIWQRDKDGFSAPDFLTALLDAGAFLLSGQQWLGPAVMEQLVALFPKVAQTEISEELEGRAAAEAQPLTISENELQQLVDYVMCSEKTSRAGAMLEDIFEVSPGEPTYEQDLRTVVECLRQDDRVVWVGGDRFLPQGGIPEYVLSVPENLHFNDKIYYDIEGNIQDVLLSDEGFKGTLKQDILSPLAQDVLDEEPPGPPLEEPPVTVRCVLKFHHKEIGTFPMCQVPPGYFPTEPRICQIEVALPSGQVVQAWVNNETRLVYGLLDWYNTVPIDTGAVFYLARESWERYVLTWGEETEPAMFVSRNRVNDLLQLREQAEAEQLTTFELLRTILEHYRKGIEFITILTELSIARRTRRRQLASLLSAYHCFYQRGTAWVYDARRLSQGFDKSRRKYLIER